MKSPTAEDVDVGQVNCTHQVNWIKCCNPSIRWPNIYLVAHHIEQYFWYFLVNDSFEDHQVVQRLSKLIVYIKIFHWILQSLHFWPNIYVWTHFTLWYSRLKVKCMNMTSLIMEPGKCQKLVDLDQINYSIWQLIWWCKRFIPLTKYIFGCIQHVQ